MTETTDNSSLPLLLSITGAILVVAVGGWFYLGHEDSVPTTTQGPPPTPTMSSVVIDTDVPAPETVQTIVGNDAAIDNDISPEPESDSEIDADSSPVFADDSSDATSSDGNAGLRKARLAASADILIFPHEQSALYYYGRVLDVDPQHAIAVAELDAVLAKVAQTVTQHLAAQEFDDAYAIAALVAKQVPEHSLVVATQQTLDDYTEQLVERAIQHVRDGEDDQATRVIATAERLPGRNPNYFTAIRGSIAEIQGVRQAAELDRQQQAQLANDQARDAWVDAIRNAIALGNLISPAGASARDLLTEPNSWVAEHSQLSDEFLVALVDTSASHINAKRLSEAEALINVAVEMGSEPERLDEVRSSLERALIDAKSNTLAPMSELVQLKTVPARYPRRAQQRNVSGYVDVVFTVTPSGETANIEIYGADPESIFEDAATEAVAQWEFQPVEFRGQAINQRAAARLVFRLE